jgi:hypothetical protein
MQDRVQIASRKPDETEWFQTAETLSCQGGSL